jgi:hypothetical protein
MPGLIDIPGDVVENINIPAFAAAGEIPIYRAQANGVVVAAFWVPSAAVTHNATNYSTLAVRNRTTGAGTALPATRSYVATDSVAFVAEAMTLDGTLANLQFAAGDVLTAQVTEAGSGLTLPAGYFDLHIRWR